MQRAHQVHCAGPGLGFGLQQVNHRAFFAGHKVHFAEVGQDGPRLVGLFDDVELGGDERDLALLGEDAQRAGQHDHHQQNTYCAELMTIHAILSCFGL